VLVPAPAPAPQVVTREVYSDCTPTREYQTEIVIDGQVVPAWGTACLQADGSWRMLSGPFAEE
jgi:surface antigen